VPSGKQRDLGTRGLRDVQMKDKYQISPAYDMCLERKGVALERPCAMRQSVPPHVQGLLGYDNGDNPRSFQLTLLYLRLKDLFVKGKYALVRCPRSALHIPSLWVPLYDQPTYCPKSIHLTQKSSNGIHIVITGGNMVMLGKWRL
jgi:hypothetical protein